MMENVTDTSANAGKENYPAGIPHASLGSMIREAREHLGLSIMDVSSQIKFAPRQIEALEADDFQHLPETAYLRGFVRSYAKVLHMDAEVLLAALPRKEEVESELIPDSVGEPFPSAHSVLRQNLIWLGAALLILIVAGYSLRHFTASPERINAAQAEQSVSLPAETPVNSAQPVKEDAVIEPVSPKTHSPKKQPSAAVAQSSVPAANTAPSRLAKNTQTDSSDIRPDDLTPITSLRLEFTEEAWAEIKDKDGKILSSRLHPGGTEMTVNGRAPFLLLIGHAASVRLYYRDKQVDLVPHTRPTTDVASLTLE